MSTVWHVISNRWNSAIAEYALRSCQALRLKGWNNILTPLADSPTQIRGEHYELDVRPLPDFHFFRRKSFSSMFKNIQPDIVITYGGPESFLFESIYSKAMPSTKWIRFLGQDGLENRLGRFKLRKFLLPSKMSKVIVPSLVVKKAITGGFTCPIEAIHLGLDTKEFFYEPSKKRKMSPEIVIFGRFDPIKGHENFMQFYLKVASYLQTEVPCLHIVGNEANLTADQLYSIAHKIGFKPTQFKVSQGRIPNVGDMMRGTLIGVIPSLGSEVICRVAQEFLMCGTPIIVSGVGSLGESLFENAGFNYHLDDSDSSAQNLARFIEAKITESESKRQARGAEAKRRFSLEKMGDQLHMALQ